MHMHGMICRILRHDRHRHRCLFSKTRFGDVNAAVGRDPVYNSAASAIEVGYDVTYDAACL